VAEKHMSQARAFFDEALAIADEVGRALAICDLAFDAEQMAKTGRRAEAIELFELLATLDRHDDLLGPIKGDGDRFLPETVPVPFFCPAGFSKRLVRHAAKSP
jgi:hypothetical protein